MSVLLIGTLDTKGAEIAYVRDRLRAAGVSVMVVDAGVLGADVSPGMVDEARRLGGRVRYDVADSAALPYADGAFDLVLLNNMIPFFDELARVTAPGGHVAVAFSMGSGTPIYVPLDRVRAELDRRGFTHVATFAEGPGTALLAKKRESS